MNKHILTIEDPIEFIYTSDQCLINQREIGQDVVDFHVAMKHAVREDPTSCWWAKCETAKPSKPPFTPRKPATWCSERFTSTAPGTIPVSSTCSPADMHAATARRSE
ncbi:MAG: hypothetical protein R3C19_07165 [Planctomycetaceae bacterium]